MVHLADDLIDAEVPCLKQMVEVFEAHQGSVLGVQTMCDILPMRGATLRSSVTMPYLSVSCFGTFCTPSTLPWWASNTSTICLRQGTSASIKSSARCTMKGDSPTTGLAHSTA